MSKLDKDQVIEKFTQAYQQAEGKAPEIEAKGGWYSVDGGKNLRLAQLDEWADELAGGGAPAPATAEKAAKPAPKAAAKKAPTPKNTGGFSVKAFWKQLIGEQDENNKAPR